MLQDAFPNPTNEHIEESNIEARKFYNLVEEANQELCLGCKEFIVSWVL